MLLYIGVLIIAVLLGTRVSRVQLTYDGTGRLTNQGLANRIYQIAIFMVLFLVSALRINTGNDYNMYINKFHDAYYDYYVVTEPGFNLITKLVYTFFNGEHYLIVFAVFSVLTVAIFLMALRYQARDYALSLFLFMSLGFYYQSLNTVRYYLALAIVFYGMRYIINSNYVRFLICIALAAMFHKSALIVILLFALARIPWKKWHIGVFAALSLTGLFLKDQYMNLILKLYPSYVNEEEYLLAGTQSIMNIGRIVLVLALCGYFYKSAIKDNKINRFYMYLNVIALALYTCFTFIPFLSRIGYYLTISQVILVPNIISTIGDAKRRKLFTGAVYVVGVVFFAALLLKMSAINIRILPYSTWLDTSYYIEDIVPQPIW